MNSVPMIDQADLKNSTVYPSGPGDLSFGILNNTLVISCVVTSMVSIV